MALPMVDRVFERIYADDSIENCDRSQELELEGSIESTPFNSNHAEGEIDIIARQVRPH
jgi:hypothetical protein